MSHRRLVIRYLRCGGLHHATGASKRLGHAFGVTGSERHGLLLLHIFTELDRGREVQCVLVLRRGDQDRINRVVFQKPPAIAESPDVRGEQSGLESILNRPTQVTATGTRGLGWAQKLFLIGLRIILGGRGGIHPRSFRRAEQISRPGDSVSLLVLAKTLKQLLGTDGLAKVARGQNFASPLSSPGPKHQQRH